jgi:hypothetical protein
MGQKLGVKVGSRLVLRHAPRGWVIPDLPEAVAVGADLETPFDIAICFVRSAAELDAEAREVAVHVPARGSLWFAWPRRAAGHVSDVTEQLLRDQVLPTGLVDVKVAALDADWSGLKFVWRRSRRPA